MNPPIGRGALAAALVAALVVAAGACSSDREAVSAPPASTVAEPTPTVGGSVPGAAATPTDAVAVESIAMVGDSITVGSQPELEFGFASLGLDDVEIDAASGRRMLVDGSIGSGIEAVEDIARRDPPDLWVIALGTNDVGNYTPEQYGPAILELLGAVPGDAPVVWVDTYLDAYPDESAAFNDTLRTILTARGRATIVDWAAIAPEDGVLSDGVHPSGFGVQAFTERVVAAVDAWKA